MLYNVFKYHHKNPIKDQWPKTITRETKREGQRKAKKCTPHKNQKKD
jgi:hypothetical protein